MGYFFLSGLTSMAERIAAPHSKVASSLSTNLEPRGGGW